MKKANLIDMYRGWFIGDFEPNILRTKDFEAAILQHKKNELWPAHYHKIATEYNVLLLGSMSINDVNITAGEIFIIEPGEISKPVFYEDCMVLCIKVPSVIGDKYEVVS